jgi:secreted trypsin-like serine protease
MNWRLFGFSFLALSITPSHAINGGVSAPSDLAAQTAMIVSTRGSYCTGTVIARDLLITAAHCVQPASNYAVSIESGDSTRMVQVARIVLHPKYDPNQFETRRPSPDMAILKLSEPFPTRYQPARLSVDTALPKPGDNFVLAGFGFARDGDEKSLGKLRSISLPTVGTTGGIMVRLSASNGSSNGACTGDSGGPAFRGGELAAVVGWVAIPAGRNCGSVTGATLVGIHREWIVSTVRTLGGSLRD